MPATPPQTAAPLVPDKRSLAALREAAAGCRGMPAVEARHPDRVRRGHREAPGSCWSASSPATRRTARDARSWDRRGALLDEALAEAGIDRSALYVTNAVKHFKWKARGKRRIHQKPDAGEVAACRPWLDAELGHVQPEVLVCLGATAAQALLGRGFRVTRERGTWVDSDLAPLVTATIHPSAILRGEPSEREAQLQGLVADLRLVAEALSG